MNRAAPFALLLLACSHFTGEQFPGRYRREGDTPSTALACSLGFSKVTVRDPRPDPNLVGDRSRQDRAGAFPVTMIGEPAQWVREGVESQLRAGAYKLGDANAPALNITLNTVDLHENVFSNADYRARVVLDVAIVLADGKTCLTTSVEGEGKNYGRAGNLDNYSQTLNRALDAITVALLNMPAVRDSTCGKCP
jgi:hypothetical protein